MEIVLVIPVNTDVALAVARSLGHKAPATYPVVKRWMEQTVHASLDDLIKKHITNPSKSRLTPES